MAQLTGEARYLDAAMRVAAWTRNVDAGDGSWTNELDPKSWKGTTVFTAIAFAEALEWHGGLLDEPVRAAWRDRLKKAGEFISGNLTVNSAAAEARFLGRTTNINYGVSGAYALLTDDRKALDLAAASFRQHLEFMLPDGGWDNS